MPSLPWMKLYVGQMATKTMGMTLESKGALLTMILMTWETGSVHRSDAEAVLGKPIEDFGRRFMDLITDANGVLSIDFVTKEIGLSSGKKKQAASAANARWIKERMRTHAKKHSGRNAKPNADAMPIEEDKEGEEELLPIGSKAEPEFGDSSINACIQHLTAVIGGRPQGSVQKNRWACKRLLGYMKEKYPDADPVERVKSLIDKGRKTYLGPQICDFMYLASKYQTVIEQIRQGDTKVAPAQPASPTLKPWLT